jgi:hypothetical protein
MKLRLAKKILACQGQINKWSSLERQTTISSYGNYSGYQKLLASIRLFKYASKNKLGKMALEALYLRPLDAFQVDSQVDLKFERLIGQWNRHEPLIIDSKIFVPPPEDRTKMVYNAMGQVHNFNAIPMPGKNDKVSYKQEWVGPKDKQYFINTVVVKKSTKRPRDVATFLRYQSRDNNNRKAPKYHV